MARFQLEWTRLVLELLGEVPAALAPCVREARAQITSAFAALAALNESTANIHAEWFAVRADMLARAIVAGGEAVYVPPLVVAGDGAAILRTVDTYVHDFLRARMAGLLCIPRLEAIQTIIDAHNERL